MMEILNQFKNIVNKFESNPDTFEFLIKRNENISNMISHIYDRYMNLPKFSDLIKEDSRKYKSFYCDKNLSSTSGLVNVLKSNKFYQLEFNDDWDIYIPNGYNRIENCLRDLIPKRQEQIIFGIQGCDNFVGKTSLWRILENYYGRETAKELIPETFILSEQEHIDLFKEKYNENEIYILKGLKQRKEGLKLTKNLNEILESKNNNFTLVQEYKRDLLLINKRKLNIRVYLLLSIKNDVIDIYMNKYGTCIYSNKEYDDSNFNFENNITSYNLDLKVYDDNPLTMKQLRTYLMDNGYNNPDILFDNMKNKINKIIEAVKPTFNNTGNLKNNLCVQVFGLDFIVDKNLNPIMLESNKGPDMKPKSGNKNTKSLLNEIENFHYNESILDKCYPDGYKTGNGIKAQYDIFKVLNIIENDDKNGFIKIN